MKVNFAQLWSRACSWLHLGQNSKSPEDVNTHVVKPRTRAAGGMSYALMKHPNGLDCEAPSSQQPVHGDLDLNNRNPPGISPYVVRVSRDPLQMKLYIDLMCPIHSHVTRTGKDHRCIDGRIFLNCPDISG